tara:strand:- start:482 stop:943 length:462 start_codon:yes stop_codon:yes gene_type:complete
MGNPLYGSNSADSKIGWKSNKRSYLNLGTTTAVVLVASDMTRAAAIAGDPNGSARTVTTPTAALMVAEIKEWSSDGTCNVGDGFEFSFINTGTAGEDETYTMTAGSGFTVVGFADVENPVTTHDAFSVGSSLWRVHVTNATSGSEACDIIRLA